MSDISLKELKNHTKDLTVLFAEDDLEVSNNISEILREIFQDVIVVYDGERGLAEYKENMERVDIILSDIVMPIKDGLAMAKEIRDINIDVPIVIVSANNELNYFEEMIKIGVDGFLLKPLILKHFINSLYKIVQKIVIKKENLEYKNFLEQKVKDIKKKLESKYYIDDITKLKNRFALLEDVKRYKSNRVILLDINKFSAINDVYGTDIGDKVLRIVTNQLLLIIPKECNLYRISSDQFVFFPYNNELVSNRQSCLKLVEKILENISLSKTFQIKKDNIVLDINISVTMSIVLDCKTTKLLESADIALQYAKKTNQNYVFYRKELHNLVNHQKSLNAVKLVKEALENDNLVPFYQPIVKNSETYYESLVRIIDSKGEIISPFFFIDEIKNTPYYVKLTQVMIEKTFNYFESKSTSFSINISFGDISNPEFIKFLKNRLNKYNVANYLVLELLESESIKNLKLVKDFIISMKSLGVRIAIDDFGSGYSNFSYLLELEPNYIKIDGSIIKNIDKDPKSYAIAKAIVNFSKELKIETIAEFIHNEAVYNKVLELEIDGRQGYFLGEPKSKI